MCRNPSMFIFNKLMKAKLKKNVILFSDLSADLWTLV